MELVLGPHTNNAGLALAPLWHHTSGATHEEIVLHFPKPKTGDPHAGVTYAILELCPFCGARLRRRKK
jgi:hypothetical protein